MSSTRVLRWSAVLASLFALSAVAAQASWHKRGHDYNRGPDRVLYATTNQNQLISFNARNPDRIRNIQAISGLASGVTLRGIDFRPATGDLYGAARRAARHVKTRVHHALRGMRRALEERGWDG